MVATISLRQSVVPRELLGRVSSAYRLIGLGSIPIGAALDGFLAETHGIQTPLMTAAAVIMAALLLALTKVNPHISTPTADQPSDVSS
ncbi:hypothetical protein N566_27035 [Streptomycetaceae bacterium MP113-05]|nr:hypothetical protein N566_27035 [Streptomycetaceae bacterium MP113-05]